MARLRLAWCWFLILAVTACGAVQRPDGGSGLLSAGKVVPRLEGRNQHGELVALNVPPATATIVYFYPKDSTPGCTREACAFRDVWRQYEEHGIAVIGVSGDDVATHLAFAQEHRLPFSLIADEHGEWASAFGVPSVFGLYSRVTFLVGQDGRVLSAYEDVDPGLHAMQILNDARSLGITRRRASWRPATVPNDALLAPAPRLALTPAPTVMLKLQLGVSPTADSLNVFWLAAEVTPPPEAHLAWNHTTESGLPTSIEFFGPSGFQIGPVQYPAPVRLPTVTGRAALGYTGPIVVLAQVTRTGAQEPDPARPETHAVFRVHGTWLSCDTRCVKEEVHESLTWDGSATRLGALESWLQQLPDAEPPPGFSARARPTATAIELSSPPSWSIEDAFVEADVAVGSRLPAFTRNPTGHLRLSPVAPPAPASVIVKARSEAAGSRHFRVSVTDE